MVAMSKDHPGHRVEKVRGWIRGSRLGQGGPEKATVQVRGDEDQGGLERRDWLLHPPPL